MQYNGTIIALLPNPLTCKFNFSKALKQYFKVMKGGDCQSLDD